MTAMPPSSKVPPIMGGPAHGAHDGARARLQGDSFTYVCSGLESRACRHAVTLLHTLDAFTSVDVETEHGTTRGQLVLVAPLVPRVLRAGNVPFVMVDLEPSHPQYRRLRNTDPSAGVLCLDHLNLNVLRDIGSQFLHQKLTGRALDKAVRDAVNQLAQAFPQPPELDERVRWMMSAIDQEPSRSLSGLAEELSLSIEHASRLFSSQVGVCLRTYSLSNKIRYAARYMGRGHSLTEVAQMAGFVDSAHFAKVWTRCYGRPPSAYFPAKKTRMDEANLPGWIQPPLE
ncbi:helix-turn-helix transcriptional regulator [Hydrogenophaga sp.]|uniref:helix-turn-helix transcriptional regulator n=1 Tax=Hydrogenophaga sp. TaxID=1904254 RepID=UPI0027185DCD|nr:helix-turn-helix transcriptional regulator [Hydrogenophaga sp.]MDO8905166.1 helix-turn-helix transcriptional regulator [Hydrogenophaga sp.]